MMCSPRGLCPPSPTPSAGPDFLYTCHVIKQSKPNLKKGVMRPPETYVITRTIHNNSRCVSTPSPLSARLGTPTTRRRVWLPKHTTSNRQSITAFARNGNHLPRPDEPNGGVSKTLSFRALD